MAKNIKAKKTIPSKASSSLEEHLKTISHPIYLFCWKDSQSLDGWEFFPDLDSALPIIYSIGFLLREDAHTVTLCLSLDYSNEAFSQALTIPKVALVYRKQISFCDIQK